MTVLPEDGHMLGPKHVGVTFIYELVRIVGNKFTCIFLFHRSCIILKRRDTNTRKKQSINANTHKIRIKLNNERVLRKMFGPTYENESWRIKTNEELDKLMKLRT